MKPHSSWTREELQNLFAWLDPDPNHAAVRYELIRHGLIERFINRGCVDAENLADETIDRVIKRVAEIAPNYQGNAIKYFHGVAKKVFLEYCRQKRKEALPPPPGIEPTFSETYYDCLEQCLNELEPVKRDLIVGYYREMKTAKIESRKEIRQELKLKPDALRVRTHRIRKILEPCIRACVERNETV